MSNDLILIKTMLKKANIDYFVFYRKPDINGNMKINNIFGAGFSPIFEYPNNSKFFDVVSETNSYLMLTWSVPNGKSISLSQSYELDQAIKSAQRNYRNMPQRDIPSIHRLVKWIMSMFGHLFK